MNEHRDSQGNASGARDGDGTGAAVPAGSAHLPDGAGRIASPDEQITLRGPAELADSLPYLLGYHPSDSVVLVALHGPNGRFGGRVKLGIPGSPGEWGGTARQLAECLIEGSRRRDACPDGIVLFLCREPGTDQDGRAVMERLRPFAQELRTACGALDVPVYEALCISGGRLWSYCCPDERCCPPDGAVLVPPGTSVLAAAAAYAGVRLRGTQQEMEARLAPLPEPWAGPQCRALDDAAVELVERVVVGGMAARRLGDDTIALAGMLMDRLAGAPSGGSPAAADAADDRLISPDEAAFVILGLQDRETRDRAAAWMEGPEAEPAARLWRALARRCVPPYDEYAAAPLALAGWVAWAGGDEPAARIALGAALRKDADYVFAVLLHQACNEAVDPEPVREWFRRGGAEPGKRTAIEGVTRPRGTGAAGRRSVRGPGRTAGGRVRPAAGRPSGRAEHSGRRRGAAGRTDRGTGGTGGPGSGPARETESDG
ncbi:DUF4192 domain-containing protein [Streptomyces sp. NPDC020875]|uniref:DUF4192 domain-containing protein n=1 Tax=Streptomyces sp. NPDC020875 TaxID=3154898 RepID=UPI0033DF16C8